VITISGLTRADVLAAQACQIAGRNLSTAGLEWI
jgi:hypothetical protein